ncbi:MAG TPA: site-2 protease family protein [Ruminococcus sp.]|nr:site-2 protease family protein [Ruminococcus sp.]
MDITVFIKYFSRIITMLLVLPLHESAHALVAKWFGDDTAERQGRISLNPLAHLDPFGGLLMVLTGFGWAKPVPINPLRMKKYRAGISLTALAGPVSNLLAAFVAGIAYNIIICTKSGLMALVSSEVTTMSCVLLLLSFLFQVNVGLAVFNLIPIPPLDGYNVLSYFTSEKVDRWFYRHQREVTFAFIVVILGLSYIPSAHNPLYIVTDFVSNALWKAVSWIPRVKWGW